MNRWRFALLGVISGAGIGVVILHDRIAQDRRDVFEDDSLFRKIGNVADTRSQFVDYVGSHRRECYRLTSKRQTWPVYRGSVRRLTRALPIHQHPRFAQ